MLESFVAPAKFFLHEFHWKSRTVPTACQGKTTLVSSGNLPLFPDRLEALSYFGCGLAR